MKIKVYLDTSVISYLDQQDAPEKMQETREIWEILKTGDEYESTKPKCAIILRILSFGSRYSEL